MYELLVELLVVKERKEKSHLLRVILMLAIALKDARSSGSSDSNRGGMYVFAIKVPYGCCK